MMCLNLPRSPSVQLKILETEGPTIWALANGKVRVRELPVKADCAVFSVSPYQVSRSPPDTERSSQEKVRTGSVTCGKRSKRE